MTKNGHFSLVVKTHSAVLFGGSAMAAKSRGGEIDASVGYSR
jgi:hypothetical protein